MSKKKAGAGGGAGARNRTESKPPAATFVRQRAGTVQRGRAFLGVFLGAGLVD